jgi:alpha-tubulin suppressor-like RCC1 family protein
MASKSAERFRVMSIRLLVGVLCFMGLVVSAPTSSSAPAATDSSSTKTSQVVIRFRGPKGVPSSVRLVGRTKIAVTQDADGPRTTRAVVKPGPYRLKAAPATFDGKTFIPVLSRSSVRVGRGETVAISVRMRRVRLASDLAGAGLTSTSASLVWRAPRGADVRVRRALGLKGPSSISAGDHVKLSAADARRRRTTDGGLKPGTTYTYTLFSRAPDGRWLSSPGLTMSTSADGAPAYAVKPGVMLLSSADSERASIDAYGVVTVDPPSGSPAMLGAAVVLPPSPDLPTGYVGRVASILPDGSLSLEQGDFASVFDYFDGSVDLATVPVLVDGAPSGALRTAARTGSGGVGWGCELSSGIDLRPAFDAGGYFRPHVDWAPWHTTGEMTLDVEMSPTVGFDVTTTTSASCGISAGVSQTFMAGPVPIYVEAKFFGSVSASGSQKVAYRLKLGRQVKAQFTGSRFTVPVNRRIFEPKETLSSNGSLSVELGSQVTFGPGAGRLEIGAVAGINGTMTFLKRSLITAPDGCAQVDQTSASSLGLKASVWVGPIAASTYVNLVNEETSHPGYPRALSGCSSPPTSSPTASPTTDPTVMPTTPPPTSAPSGQWAQISPSDGGQTTCAITTASTLWCWGRNFAGQLGIGRTSEQEIVPQQVPGVGWASVDTSGIHTCAVKVDNSAWCWGGTSYWGELGNGSLDQQWSPTQVQGSGWRSLRLGGNTTCGVKLDGSLWCWGQKNLSGLDDPSHSHEPNAVPTRVDTHTWASMDVGTNHVCATRSEGAVYCWGMNDSGQLGDGSRENRYAPTPVFGLGSGSTVEVSAGFTHTCAREPGGALHCWGANHAGQLGGGEGGYSTLTPQAVSGSGWTDVDAGFYQTCGLGSSSTAWCWGGGWQGQLGTGNEDNKYIPAQLPGAWRSLDTGGHYTCGIKTDGSAWCWGDNDYGQLGDGTTEDRWTPVRVMSQS